MSRQLLNVKYLFAGVIPMLLMHPVQVNADPGVTPTEVVIGAHTTETGKNADNVDISRAVSAYFEDVNAKGGIHGRKIKYIRIDAAGIAAKAVDATRKLVEQENIFAMVGAVGAAPHLAVYKYLIEKGVPDLWFGDTSEAYVPIAKTVFPGYVRLKSDGEIAAKYITQNFKGKSACFLMANHDGAISYQTGAKAVLDDYNKSAKEEDKIKMGPVIKADRLAANMNVEVLQLKRAKCDVVFVLQTHGLFASAVNYGFDQGFQPKWVTWHLNVRAKNIALLREKARDGVISGSFLVRDEPLDPTGGKIWKDYMSFIKKHKIDDEGTAATGYYMADMFTEALRRAGKDLTREKIISAAESMKGYQCKICLMPVGITKDNHWAYEDMKLVVVKNNKWHFLK